MPSTTSSRAALIFLARAVATAHSLDPALVCAICEQESSWNPWAMRYEPAFFARYIRPLLTEGNSLVASPSFTNDGGQNAPKPSSGEGGSPRPSPSNFAHLSPTEAYARAFSWGLMQVMGQVAREQNFVGPSFAELCDPAIGLEIGCRVLDIKLRAAQGDVQRALQLWNGGSNPNYAAEVLARRAQYK
jgi:soluble lytic murein transglycosylase-like protein